MSWGKFLVIPAVLAVAVPLAAQTRDFTLFETKIRPVLETKCYGCHLPKLKAPMGGLTLDTKAGLLKGGATGKVIVPAKPGESRLLKALSYSDPSLQMPPAGKLPDSVIANFKQWISAGSPDPRSDVLAGVSSQSPAPQGMSIEDGRKWWAFQPVKEMPKPNTKDVDWNRTKSDWFVLAKLEEKGLTPSPDLDPAWLV